MAVLAPIEIIAVIALLAVAAAGLIAKAALRRGLDDIEGASEVFEVDEDQGEPVAKL